MTEKASIEYRHRQMLLFTETQDKIKTIAESLRRVNTNKVTVLDFPESFLQEIAFSIEIILKNALKILHYNKHNNIPELKSYGHDIVKLAQQVLNEEDNKARQKQLAKEDLYFWQNDKALQKLLELLTDYGKGGRYYSSDYTSGKAQEPNRNPKEQWSIILDELGLCPEDYLDSEKAACIVIEGITFRINRFLRCIAQSVCYSVNSEARRLASSMNSYLMLKDRDIKKSIDDE